MKVKCESEVAQSCLTLCDPMDRSLPGSSIHGILQTRVLEWVAVAFSVQVYNTVIHNIFDDYSPFIVIIEYWLYSLCCTIYLFCLFCMMVCVSSSPAPLLPLLSSLCQLVTTSLFSKSVNIFLVIYTSSLYF